MQHFLEISQLSTADIEQILARANHFKRSQQYPNFHAQRLVNLFYENSTRTRISFELAAQNLSIPVINFSQSTSSESKGESVEDTIKTLAAMGVNLFVVRHTENGLPQFLAETLDKNKYIYSHIINAGDGTHAHPTQALLDVMTILEVKPDLQNLKVAIIGNISHSRVANSLQAVFKTLGVGQVYLVAPEVWQPSSPILGVKTHSLAEGLENADVIICLRVQKERLEESAQLNLATYRREYALTQAALSMANKDAIVLHPGPVNRGIEIDSEVADGAQACILQQVNNGIFMRMAILEFMVDVSGTSCEV